MLGNDLLSDGAILSLVMSFDNHSTQRDDYFLMQLLYIVRLIIN